MPHGGNAEEEEEEDAFLHKRCFCYTNHYISVKVRRDI